MLLVNLVNIRRGGAKQVALSFLDEIRINNLRCLILINTSLVREVDISGYDSSKVGFVVADLKFAHPVRALKFLKNLHSKYGILKVIILFGPFYSLKCWHTVSGFADGWAYLETSQLNSMNFLRKFKNILFARIKLQLSLLFSNELFVETDYAKSQIISKRFFLNKPIHVVHNAINPRLMDNNHLKGIKDRCKSRIKLIYVASYYEHKNFSFLKELSTVSPDFVEIYVTLSDKEYHSLFGGSTNGIYNLGVLALEELKVIYQEMDGVIFPSRLETFSAGILEAWYFKLPLFIGPFSFFKDICKDRAFYIDLDDANRTMEIIINVIANLDVNVLNEYRKYVDLNYTSKVRYNSLLALINK